MDLHTLYSTVSFRMTLSDLAKYLMTRSIARPLCDSRATCIIKSQHCNYSASDNYSIHFMSYYCTSATRGKLQLSQSEYRSLY